MPAQEFNPQVYADTINRHGPGPADELPKRLLKPLAAYLDSCFVYSRVSGTVRELAGHKAEHSLPAWKDKLPTLSISLRAAGLDVAYVFTPDCAFRLWQAAHPLSAASLQPLDEDAYRHAVIEAGKGKDVQSISRYVVAAVSTQLNKSFAFLRQGGYLAVDPSPMGGYEITLLKREQFAQRLPSVSFSVIDGRFEREFTLTGNDAIGIWLASPSQQRFVAHVYAPPPLAEQTSTDFLNLYDRPGITRAEAVAKGNSASPHVAAFLDHLRNNFCGGNEESFRFALGWLAHVIQKPGVKRYSAFVARGDKGTGKSMLAKLMMRIVGMQHCKMPQNPAQVFGRFADLSNSVFCYLSEMFWSGDHGCDSALKRLITEEISDVEVKGKATHRARILCGVFIDGNSQWVVPASGLHERRYFVLDTNNALVEWKRTGDPRFAALVAAMGVPEGQPNAAGDWDIARFLYEHDLAGFDHSKVPATEALQEQAAEGLAGFNAWWAGRLSGVDRAQFERPVSKEALLNAYKEETRDNHMNAVRLGKRLRSVVSFESCQHGRKQCYRFPRLEVAIEQFRAKCGHGKLCDEWLADLRKADADEKAGFDDGE